MYPNSTFSFKLVAVLAVASGFNFATALRPFPRQVPLDSIDNKNATSACSSADIYGAAYTMTNLNGGDNFVVAIPVFSNGTLGEGVELYSTGGKGGVGRVGNVVAGTAFPDSLFSANSIKVRRNKLLAVNPGSNSVSLFQIGACPTNLTLLSVVNSGGTFPTSVAINSFVNETCVLNGGAENGVACASLKNGTLEGFSQLLSTGLDQKTPPVGPMGTVSDLVFDQDNNLLVSVKGTRKYPGYMAVVNLTSGAPASLTKFTPTGGAYPFSLTPMPANFSSNNVVVATDPAVGIVSFRLDSNLTNVASIPTSLETNLATGWSDYCAITNSVFTSDVLTSQISEVTIDPITLQGTVIARTRLGYTKGATDLKVGKMKNGLNMLFVNTAGNLSISVMLLEVGGNSKVIQTFDLAAAIGTIPNATALTKCVQGIDVKMIR